MGTYISVYNTRNQRIFNIKMTSSYEKPKELMDLFNSIYGSGEGLFIETDSKVAKKLLQFFEAHIHVTEETNKTEGFKYYANQGETLAHRIKSENEYWQWGLSQLRKALRTHKHVVLYVG